MKANKLVIIGVLLSLSMAAKATLFTYTDENGVTSYTDTPTHSSAIPIATPKEDKAISTGGAQPTTIAPVISTSPAISERVTYTTFTITSPTEGATIQNQPNLMVTFKIEPDLQQGDTIQVQLDGASWGEPIVAKSVDLGQLERGEHVISAILMDKDKKTLITSNAVKIFVHRVTLNSPSRQSFKSKSNLPLQPIIDVFHKLERL